MKRDIPLIFRANTKIRLTIHYTLSLGTTAICKPNQLYTGKTNLYGFLTTKLLF